MSYPHPKVPYKGPWFASALRKARLFIENRDAYFICNALRRTDEFRVIQILEDSLTVHTKVHTYNSWIALYHSDLFDSENHKDMRLGRLYWIDTMIKENEHEVNQSTT
jgi:hypothetical protein